VSTRHLRELISRVEATTLRAETKARAELDAIEEAAQTLTRLNVGDGVYSVRDREEVMEWSLTNVRSTWEHPDVKAWSDVAVLLAAIAKETK